MAIKHEALIGRSDSYRVDPTKIKIEEGWNPRVDFDTPEDEELKNSIIENGVMVPIRIKKNSQNEFVLIDGERRLKSTLKAIEEGNDIQSIPAMVERAKMNQVEAMFMALITNTGKKLGPIEEAEAFNRLKQWGVTVDDIAKRMGVSVPHVYGRISLIDLSPKAKEALAEKKIGISMANNIVKTSDGDIEKQDTMVDEAVVEKKKPRKPKTDAPKPKVMGKRDIKTILDSYIANYEDVCVDLALEETETGKERKQFFAGAVKGICEVMGEEVPFEMKY